jgi:ribosomal protein S18 acetylase RimI-like enzyme
MSAFHIRPLEHRDHTWVAKKIVSSWGAEIAVVHGEVFHPADLPGFAAFDGQEPVGLLTFNIIGRVCEIVTLDSWREGLGIGTALIRSVQQVAEQAGCKRLFLVTTNNNTHALHFYQRCGFLISSVRLNALTESRLLKPEIPLTDDDGLPIRDEIELEMYLL